MSRRAPIIVGILAGLAAVLVFVFIVLPKFREVDRAEEDLREAQAREVTLEAELARLQAAAEDLPRLQRQLARFRRAVPPIPDLPGLINQLQDAAELAGVDFFAISPGDPTATPQGQAAVIPAQVQVIGSFFPVDEFLFRLENLRRATEVTSVDVGEGPDGLPQVDVVLQVNFFTTDLDAGPGAAPQAEPGPGATPTPEPSPGATPTPGEPTPGEPTPAVPGE